MTRLRIVLFILVGISSYAFSQSFWTQKGGGLTIEEGMDITVDGAGNSYTTGYFAASCTFGSNTVSSNGVTDIYVTKNIQAGAYAWAVKAGGPMADRGLAIKSDNSGNVYVTGYFSGTATFGTQTVTSAGLQDVFIAKYDNAGILQWVKSAGGPMNDIGYGIDVDNSGNVAVTGEFSGTSIFGIFPLTSLNGSIDVFTTKLDVNGGFLWAKKGSAPLTDKGLDVAFDATGNVFICGQFSDTITFDVVHNNNMLNAIFVVKYNASGVEQWFRRAGGGSVSISNAIDVDNNNNVLVAGDFQGTLTFYGTPNTTLSNSYPNRIFLAKYDNNGGMVWSEADGSGAPITVRNLAIDPSGNPFVVGHFKCRMNEYADQYGQGVFCSVGYWDIFVTKYNSAGAWQWSRQIGGKQDTYGHGIALNSTGEVFITGAFDQDIFFPTGFNYLGYNSLPLNCNPSYCSDANYGQFRSYTSTGNTDVFVAKAIDPAREPYDFFHRMGSGCARPFHDVCVTDVPVTIPVGCPDTLIFCGNGLIYANTYSCPNVGPVWNYQWSNNQVSSWISVIATGYYWVNVSSADGCFTMTDSIYVIINPLPAVPFISDNVVINTNAQFPQPIVVCLPDTVELWGTNICPGCSIVWTGPGLGPNGVPNDSIVVPMSGTYCFTVTDSNGCSRTNCVLVKLDSLLPPIDYHLTLMNDPDQNDTVEFCEGGTFSYYIWDSITNPNMNYPICLPNPNPYITVVTWTVSPFINSSYSCQPANNIAFFTPTDTGWYTVTATIIRTTVCDTDTTVVTDSVYVILYPLPTAAVQLSGNNWLCPGDSILLVATGGTTYTWFTPPNSVVGGNGQDSIIVNLQGVYSVSSSVTNQWGCTATAFASIFIQVKPQPNVTMNPSTGLICPNDSILLTTTGTGNFQWVGPMGPFGPNVNNVWVNTPGFYYCIVTDIDSCQLVSNTVQVIQYATPSIAAAPNSTICFGDSVIISVVASAGAIIQWLAPLSGNDTSQVIFLPGTYSVVVTSCGITVTVSIVINMSLPTALITPTGSLNFCQGDSVLLTANSGMQQYVWSPVNALGQSIFAMNPGIYTVTVTDAFGCTATDTIAVSTYPNFLPAPVVNDTSICPGFSVTLTATGVPAISWIDPQFNTVVGSGNSFVFNNVLSPVTYYVVSDSGGCRSPIDTVTVSLGECPETLPNVFSPNGDGSNDSWFLDIPGAKSIHCKIYNRWGNLIYTFDSVVNGWDGTIMQTGLPASDGVYYYIGAVEMLDGSVFDRVGFIQLLRN